MCEQWEQLQNMTGRCEKMTSTRTGLTLLHKLECLVNSARVFQKQADNMGVDRSNITMPFLESSSVLLSNSLG